MTVVEHVTVPPAPFTVNVYTVVTSGDTVSVPLTPTAPTPWFIDADVAFDEVQVSLKLP